MTDIEHVRSQMGELWYQKHREMATHAYDRVQDRLTDMTREEFIRMEVVYHYACHVNDLHNLRASSGRTGLEEETQA